MSIGTDLMNMKQSAKEARANVIVHEKKKESWYDTVATLGVMVLTFGIVAAIMGLVMMYTAASLGKQDHFGGYAIAGAIVAVILGVSGIRLPSFLEARDEELVNLKAAETSTFDGYRSALMAEAETYGVNISTMRDRSKVLDSDYEFTALRGPDPVDVTVRDFGNEVVFMLNGERMQKPVTV